MPVHIIYYDTEKDTLNLGTNIEKTIPKDQLENFINKYYPPFNIIVSYCGVGFKNNVPMEGKTEASERYNSLSKQVLCLQFLDIEERVKNINGIQVIEMEARPKYFLTDVKELVEPELSKHNIRYTPEIEDEYQEQLGIDYTGLSYLSKKFKDLVEEQ